MSEQQRILVIGNGMAGCRFVQEVLERDLDRQARITVIGDEPGDAYNRMQLTNVLAGATSADNLTLASARWYAEHGVTLLSATVAVRIERANRTVQLGDGSMLPYDVLVLATGSTAVIPPIDGVRDSTGELKAGVVPFRTLADCLQIDRLADDARAAAVLGAGVLGLEAARGLAGRDLEVTLLQRGRRLMERQLDAGASRALARTAHGLGVVVRPDAAATAVLGDRRVEAIELADGTVLPAQLLVLSCGVQPRVELARAAGLDVEEGIVVDDQLRSGDPAVFAIGECAQHRGELYGLVAPAWEQARTAAEVITRPQFQARYVGSSTVVRLKADGIELVSLGDPSFDHDDPDSDAELVHFSDSGRGIYQKLVVRNGRLSGAILLGDTRAAGTLTQLFDRAAELPADRAGLLVGPRGSSAPSLPSPIAMPAHATICNCNGVTKAGICQAWEDGATDIAGVAARTRATTGCGTCRDTVDGILDWLSAADAGASAPIEDAAAGRADLVVELAP